MQRITEKGYAAEFDSDADATAAAALSAAGYDASAFSNYIGRTGEGREKTALHGKLHAPSTKRIEMMNAIIESEGLNEEGYKRGRERFNEYKESM